MVPRRLPGLPAELLERPGDDQQRSDFRRLDVVGQLPAPDLRRPHRWRGGGVQLTYNGIGAQTHVNLPFTVLMTGTLSDRILKVAGRAGSAGRDFTMTIQCP